MKTLLSSTNRTILKKFRLPLVSTHKLFRDATIAERCVSLISNPCDHQKRCSKDAKRCLEMQKVVSRMGFEPMNLTKFGPETNAITTRPSTPKYSLIGS